MPIERQTIVKPPKRQKAELEEKARKIARLLKLDPVPTHTLAWKEPRLETDNADCFPLIDVLEKVAELLAATEEKPAPAKAPKRRFPKKEE